jgi:hypothetical protein
LRHVVSQKVRAMSESILEEAHRLTHGPRNKDYGHPLDDYTRTAALVSAMLAHKLKAPITAHEMALAMCCVKLSREMNAPKRDNAVDLAGYAWVARECLEEAERRKAAQGLDSVSDDAIWRAAAARAEAIELGLEG